MSQPPIYQNSGYEAIILLLFLAIGSAAFGYIVGKNDKNSYLYQQQNKPPEKIQPSTDIEDS